ncbi:MAG: GntR family transcriptional regulator [Limnohabitans sp.]
MTTDFVNAHLGQSRYGKLAQALRDRILQGEWGPGALIPAEAALAQSYGVALGTIRQALSLLVEDGVLQRRHGKGTFVTKGVDGASMMRFFRFRGVDDGGGLTPHSRILASRLRTASAHESHAFGIAQGAQVLQLERLRSLHGEPCLLETIVLPLPLFGPLAESDTDAWDDLLYPMYQQRCGVVIQKTQDSLSFSQLNAGQAKRLKLAVAHPCVLVERQAFDMAGRCVELRTTRGDAFSFKYTAQVQ